MGKQRMSLRDRAEEAGLLYLKVESSRFPRGNTSEVLVDFPQVVLPAAFRVDPAWPTRNNTTAQPGDTSWNLSPSLATSAISNRSICQMSQVNDNVGNGTYLLSTLSKTQEVNGQA